MTTEKKEPAKKQNEILETAKQFSASQEYAPPSLPPKRQEFTADTIPRHGGDPGSL